MRHKQILDVAAENPEASIAELAAEVPSATTDLVKRVLEEHGDPAEENGESAESDQPTPTDGTDTSATDSGSTAPDSYPDPDDLSPAERETIAAIRDHPTASQRDLAETLGVTASTVSNRVNGIDGFEWSNRETFAKGVLGDDQHPEPSTTETTQQEDGRSSAETADSDPASDTDGAESTIPAETVDDTISAFQSTVEALSGQLDDLEGQVETVADGGSSSAPFEDPELVHKVVHACMDSQNITEDEELRILESLV